MDILAESVSELKKALLKIDRLGARAIFETYAGTYSSVEIEEVVTLVLEEIGAGWENGTVSLAQVYMSGLICEELVDEFFPDERAERVSNLKIAICVLLDCHALGKRIVLSVLRASGYDVIDLGVGLTEEDAAAKAAENDLDVLLISTLMSVSSLQVRRVRELLDEKGSHAKIIVGGAPFRFDPSLWKRVGAFADGKNASELIPILEKLEGFGDDIS